MDPTLKNDKELFLFQSISPENEEDDLPPQDQSTPVQSTRLVSAFSLKSSAATRMTSSSGTSNESPSLEKYSHPNAGVISPPYNKILTPHDVPAKVQVC